MSLATTCPQCRTSFKVVPDQLKLRRGLVRCGICRHVFSGVDYLKYLEDSPDAARATASMATAPTSTGPPGTPISPGTPIEPIEPIEPGATPAASAPAPQTAPQGAGIPSERAPSPPPWSLPAAASAADAAPDTERSRVHERTGEHFDAFERSDREPFDLAFDRVLIEREPADRERADRERADREPADREPTDRESTDREPTDRESTDREPTDREPADQEPVVGEPVLGAPTAHGAVDHQLGTFEPAGREGTDHELGDLAFVDRKPDEHTRPETAIDAPGSHLGAPAIDDDIFGDTRVDAPSRDAFAGTDRVAARRAPAAEETRETGSPDDDAVDFFSTNERSGGFATRATVFAALAAFVLGIALAFQLAIAARDWLAAALPILRPALVAATAPLGLSVQPPRQLGALTIESFELQSAGDSGLLSMSALLRNAVDHPVRWPAMELSLTDGSGAVVVRKVLQPADYLAGASRGETDGVAARAEWPLRVALEPQGVEPTAYSVKLFYP